MTKSVTSVTSVTGAIFLFIILYPLILMYTGWALMVLWNWFIPPVLGWVALTLPHAMGINLVAAFFSIGKMQKDLSAAILLVPLFLVGVGWILQKVAF